MDIIKTTLTDIQSFISSGHKSSSDLGLQGPCLPWCYTHNRLNYIIIGILIGIILTVLYYRFAKSKKRSYNYDLMDREPYYQITNKTSRTSLTNQTNQIKN